MWLGKTTTTCSAFDEMRCPDGAPVAVTLLVRGNTDCEMLGYERKRFDGRR